MGHRQPSTLPQRRAERGTGLAGVSPGWAEKGGRRTEKGRGGSAFISRILCRRPFDRRCDHLSDDPLRGRPLPAQDATITRSYPSPCGDLRPGGPFLLFCLAPHGVCRASFLTVGAVGSYPAVSPLPSFALASCGGRFVFCDTFHDHGLPRGLRRLRAARCLVVSGLSSRLRTTEAVPSSGHSGRPADSLAFDEDKQNAKTGFFTGAAAIPDLSLLQCSGVNAALRPCPTAPRPLR